MNRQQRRLVLTILLGASVMGVAYLVAIAGDLEPPAPPGPTMKPLSQIEPRFPIRAETLPLTITQPGSSWYLAENIETSGAGIDVQADNVTIDLNGFTLRGGTGNGINSSWPYEGTTVRNGTITHWSGHGVALQDGGVVEDLSASHNSGNGIQIRLEGSIQRCSARWNSGHGIAASGLATIISCVATLNFQNGIYGGFDVLVRSCVSDNNYHNGIRVDNSSYVVDNSCRGNSLAVGNNFAGIWVTGSGNRIEGNHCTNNQNGFDIDGGGNTIVRNTSSANLGFAYDVAAGTTGNIVGTIRTDAASAGPWDNFSN